MQVFKQFHKILLDIFNHMLPTIYTVKSLEPVLNCTEHGKTPNPTMQLHSHFQYLDFSLMPKKGVSEKDFTSSIILS